MQTGHNEQLESHRRRRRRNKAIQAHSESGDDSKWRRLKPDPVGLEPVAAVRLERPAAGGDLDLEASVCRLSGAAELRMDSVFAAVDGCVAPGRAPVGAEQHGVLLFRAASHSPLTFSWIQSSVDRRLEVTGRVEVGSTLSFWASAGENNWQKSRRDSARRKSDATLGLGVVRL
ncbi:hypothetical protein EYF80_037001 [Liparis tanakae]|uniref:Uncharacterized protein n=1 Tax=Liparis tanakae TaxID=230148 RepID=A0A4Z2GGU6_9TELE|nr:hypothetical protein EYF80_037001 [Liparis tanakae]